MKSIDWEQVQLNLSTVSGYTYIAIGFLSFIIISANWLSNSEMRHYLNELVQNIWKNTVSSKYVSSVKHMTVDIW